MNENNIKPVDDEFEEFTPDAAPSAADASAPSADASAPSAEASAPSAPSAEASAPSAEASAPSAEASAPSAEASQEKHKYANCHFQTNAISIKIYPENLAKDGQVDDANDAITWAPVMRATLHCMAQDPACPFFFDSIVHDRCSSVMTEEFHVDKPKKVHGHVNLYWKGRYASGLLKRVSLSVWFKTLAKYSIYMDSTEGQTNEMQHSIAFPDIRKGEDKRLLVYLTHETPAALRDGKAVYERREVITNRPLSVTREMYEIYDKCLAYTELTASEKALYIFESQKLGTAAYPWTVWINSLPYVVRMDTRLMKAMHEAYAMGIDQFVNSHALMVRCCIHIDGAPNSGKTYTTKKTLETLGYCTYCIEGGKTGKYDGLDARYNALAISDTSFGDPLAATDNMPTRMYRRGSGNPLWSGDMLVVSFNGSMDKYIDYFYPDVYGKNDGSRAAFKSRFYECEIKDNRLALREGDDAVSTRGDEVAQIVRTKTTAQKANCSTDKLAQEIERETETEKAYSEFCNENEETSETHDYVDGREIPWGVAPVRRLRSFVENTKKKEETFSSEEWVMSPLTSDFEAIDVNGLPV